jgi:hypothetical protein
MISSPGNDSARVNLLAVTIVAAALLSDEQPLELPRAGDHQLRIVAPDTLELTLITSKEADPAPVGLRTEGS